MRILWAFNVASWLLGGVYYPISVLPGWLQQAALFIPTTHSLEALRLSLLGRQGISSLGDPLLALGLWAMVGLLLSLLAFRYALSRARSNGTVGHY